MTIFTHDDDNRISSDSDAVTLEDASLADPYMGGEIDDLALSLLVAPLPGPSSVTLPVGPSVDAQDDTLTVPQSAQSGSFNLFDDNGNGQDTAPAGDDVIIVAINGVPFTGSGALSTQRGAFIEVSDDGTVTIETVGAYDFLGAGESIEETFTYTIEGTLTQVIPGDFDAVIDVTSLSPADGFTIVGVDADDFSGVAVSGIGDVNNDGFDDLLIGGYRAGSNFEGEAYIVFGGASLDGILELASGSFGPSGLGGFALAGFQEIGLLGQAVAGGGDFNADGIDDLIVATPRFDTQSNENAGAVDILFGGQGNNEVALGGLTIFGAGTNDYAGLSVANAGDINNDGIDDILVGAWPADPSGRFEAGEVYVVFGADVLPDALNVDELNGNNGFTLEGIAAGDRAGFSIASAGDFNGDGITDIIIGAPEAGTTDNPFAGAAYVVHGAAGGFANRINLEDADFTLTGAGAGDNLGRAVSSAGDLNGDGVDDIAIGAYNADNGAFGSAGAVYIVFGEDTRVGTLSADQLNGINGFAIWGVETAGQLGVSVSSVGDVNADGIDDLLIGAHLEGSNSGAAYVVFGNAQGFAANLDVSDLDGTNGFKIEGPGGANYLGWSVAGVGDVNGDNINDMAVTAFGADEFTGETYIIYGRGTPGAGRSTATVTVEFVGENDAPVAQNVTATVSEDGPATVIDSDFVDIDLNDVHIFSVDTTNTTGTVTNNNDGSFTYDPNGQFEALPQGQSATDTFTYTVDDQNGGVDTRTVTVTINGVNDAPVSSAAPVFDIGEEDSLFTLTSGTANVLDTISDPDTPFNNLVVSAVEGNAGNVGASVDLSHGTLTVSTDGTVDFVTNATGQSLSAGEVFNQTFMVTISDGQGGTVDITGTISITGENDFPVAQSGSLSISEDGPPEDIIADVTDIDANDMLEFTLELSGTIGSVIDNNDGTFTYDPNGQFDFLAEGDVEFDFFGYTVSDGNGGTDTGFVEITINGVNDAPTVSSPPSFSINEEEFLASATSGTANVLDNATDPDTPFNDLFVSEVEGSAANVGSSVNLTNGLLFINSDGSIDYEPGAIAQTLSAGDTPLQDSFTYVISDGQGGTTTVTGTINISGVNDNPVVNAVTATVSEDGPVITVTGDFSDIDQNDILSFSINTSATLGTVTNNNDGTFLYNPNGQFEALASGQSDTDSFTYTVMDDKGGMNTATVTITINGADEAAGNTLPTANNVTGATSENAAAITINADFIDPDIGDSFTFVVNTSGTAGTVINNNDGTFSYDPNGQFESLPFGAATTDTFTYTVNDGNGDSNTATVTIDITGEDDVPVAVDDDGFQITATGAVTNGDVLGNDFDVDVGEDPALFAANGAESHIVPGNSFTLPSGATVSFNADGTFNYTPPTSFSTLTGSTTLYDSFSYKLDDGTLEPGGDPFTDLGNQANDYGDAEITGTESYEGIGRTVQIIGDVNGDGIDDLAFSGTGAFGGPEAGVGRVYVVFGRTDDPMDFDLGAIDGTDGFLLTGVTPYDGFGASIEAVGDVNGDNIDDFAVTASTDGGTKVYVVYGRDVNQGGSFQAQESVGDLDGTDGFEVTHEYTYAFFGNSISAAGDLNDDSYDDIIIGSQNDNGQGAGGSEGQVYVLFGSSANRGATTSIQSEITNSRAMSVSAVTDITGFGISVSGGGDVNGDGISDVIIGSSGSVDQATGMPTPPKAFVIFGSNSLPVGGQFDADSLDGTNGFEITDSERDFSFAQAVSLRGDINGDGVDDVLIGAPYATTNLEQNTGQVFVLFGRNTAVEGDFAAVVDPDDVDGSNGFIINGESARTQDGLVTGFGSKIDVLKDANGDGFDEIAISGARYTNYADISNPVAISLAYVIFGDPDGFNAEMNVFAINGENGAIFTNDRGDLTFGGGGDVNGDGIGDLIVGDKYYDDITIDPSRIDIGKTYIFFGDDNLGDDPSNGEVEIRIDVNGGTPIATGSPTLFLIGGTYSFPTFMLGANPLGTPPIFTGAAPSSSPVLASGGASNSSPQVDPSLLVFKQSPTTTPIISSEPDTTAVQPVQETLLLPHWYYQPLFGLAPYGVSSPFLSPYQEFSRIDELLFEEGPSTPDVVPLELAADGYYSGPVTDFGVL